MFGLLAGWVGCLLPAEWAKAEPAAEPAPAEPAQAKATCFASAFFLFAVSKGAVSSALPRLLAVTAVLASGEARLVIE
jgi:hypothetical protein